MKKILSLFGIFALSGVISGNLTACHKDTETNNIDQEIANVLKNMKDVKDIDKTEDGWQFVNETFLNDNIIPLLSQKLGAKWTDEKRKEVMKKIVEKIGLVLLNNEHVEVKQYDIYKIKNTSLETLFLTGY
ncbi:hypothetical protein [Spiroplasma phoeniceum]|uniref:Lipoprotein n=1 Tax=Spiroplasma phoeniceum P40 TaxID=1276259 RepID=A0A345DME0_9MOLU|nr:hypothetical protein [Spiroplasma phoeniceum]AXF95378.1 hypothetical protein SDAV_00384 [Spiroplasma phoeniceum P40]